ncbi:hypothetical protein FA15DRAFT_486592 [Coprinopsis marcescibilis]|uniref:Uncharacterized protein n=1 Tax=Coprinopsis marcescibilis TaxID=230819 RepID=A0A5C3L8P4_COPMA|nr:hypothetical protein FA15DRAFT_486592 [Coprinopsis marcescibilis]
MSSTAPTPVYVFYGILSRLLTVYVSFRAGNATARQGASYQSQDATQRDQAARVKIVEILSQTANGCLAELNYDPKEMEKLKARNAQWQSENVKLYEDNMKLNDSCNAMRAQVEQLTQAYNLTQSLLDRLKLPNKDIYVNMHNQIASLQSENRFLKDKAEKLEEQQPGKPTYAELFNQYNKLLANHQALISLNNQIKSHYTHFQSHCAQCPIYIAQQPVTQARSGSTSAASSRPPSRSQISYNTNVYRAGPDTNQSQPNVATPSVSYPQPAIQQGNRPVLGPPPQASSQSQPAPAHQIYRQLEPSPFAQPFPTQAVASGPQASNRASFSGAPSIQYHNQTHVAQPPGPSQPFWNTNAGPRSSQQNTPTITHVQSTGHTTTAIANTVSTPSAILSSQTHHAPSSHANQNGIISRPQSDLAALASHPVHNVTPPIRPQSYSAPLASTSALPSISDPKLPNRNLASPVSTPSLAPQAQSPSEQNILVPSLSRKPSPLVANEIGASSPPAAADPPPSTLPSVQTIKRPLSASQDNGTPVPDKKPRLDVEINTQHITPDLQPTLAQPDTQPVAQSADVVMGEVKGEQPQGTVDNEDDEEEEEVPVGPDGLRLAEDIVKDLFEDKDDGNGKICVLCKPRVQGGYIPERVYVNASVDELATHCEVEHHPIWYELRHLEA